MSTWTLEHAKLIVAAWPDVELRPTDRNQWIKPNAEIGNWSIRSLGDPNIFRLPPKKRLVEWTAEDVKPGMVFRTEGMADEWLTLASVGKFGINWHLGGSVGWHDLLRNKWQWSIDASPGSWRPCAKEVEG